jgi:uncharacterized protein (TIGR00369 family)
MTGVAPQPSTLDSGLARTPSQARLEAVRAREHPQCVACSPLNPFGLRLGFEVQSDGSVAASVVCRDDLQSYPRTVHGGVISALLDAAMTNVLFSRGIVAVTAELTVRFLAPAQPGRVALVRAALEPSTSHLLYRVRAQLEQDRTLVARASARFLVRGPPRDLEEERTRGRGTTRFGSSGQSSHE